MDPAIIEYNKACAGAGKAICKKLAAEIDRGLPGATSKIWHAHPVWFLDDNPIVGYSQQKPGIRLMFWSGADFDEPALNVLGAKFKDSSIFYQRVAEVDEASLQRWLRKSIDIQWDYKNIVKRKGKLVRLNQPKSKSDSPKSSRNDQSAAERKSVESQVRALVEKFAPEHVRLVASARKWFHKRLPTANELVYAYRSWFVISYSPTVAGYQGVLSIRGDEAGVRLYLSNGKELPDPAKLLQGSGKQVRWIALERASTLSRPEVTGLIEASISRSAVPFAGDGQGELLLRTSSAKLP